MNIRYPDFNDSIEELEDQLEITKIEIQKEKRKLLSPLMEKFADILKKINSIDLTPQQKESLIDMMLNHFDSKDLSELSSIGENEEILLAFNKIIFENNKNESSTTSS